MSPLSQSLLPILFVLMTIEGSTAGILDNFGLNLLNHFPFTSNDVNDGSASEQWPSFVKIVDAADLPSLLYASMNVTSHNSSGSAWSNLLNIFGSGDSISDEMERENGAWFAIPGWNKAMVNGSGLAHTILPGLIVPAKLEPHQMYDVANRLNPLFNNFSKIFPLGFLFNHDQNINLNPFNLPFLPELNGKSSEDLKSKPEVPQKIQSTLETADIKPSSENKENVVETPNLKDAPKIRAIRSIFQRFLNVANDENAEIKDGDKIVNVIEPVKETGVQMEPIPTTESNPEINSEPQKPNSEDTRTLGAIGLLGPLLNLFSGSLGGSPINTLTNDLQSLGTLRPPSSSSSSSSSLSSYNNQNGPNVFNGQNVPNPFFGIR